MSFSGDGIYRIHHAHAPVRVALSKGSSDDETPVVGWNVNDDSLNHLWMVKSVLGETDTYRIQNLVSGTYMDLAGSSASNGTLIIGFHKTSPGENQKWIIKKETTETGFWKIQNKATQTFVDLLNGSDKDGASIVGCQGSWEDRWSAGHQHWTFELQSLHGKDIHTTLRANPYLRQDFQSYVSDGMYLILSRARLEEIWRNSGLQNHKWRSEIFDCDDFSFVYKAEVAKWGEEHFKADGFAVLCGVMFGSGSGGAHAYNWMIDDTNHLKVIFFEPQNSQFSNNLGYYAYFGVF